MKVELTDGTKVITLKDATKVTEDDVWILVIGEDWWHKFKKDTITAICATGIEKKKVKK